MPFFSDNVFGKLFADKGYIINLNKAFNRQQHACGPHICCPHGCNKQADFLSTR